MIGRIGSSVSTFILALMLLASSTPAQDPVRVVSDAFKERLNNNRVRVLEYWSKPGEKEPMHSHPDFVIYAITKGKIRSTGPDGNSVDTEFKAGDVVWRPALTHSVENIGKTTFHAILIEIPSAKNQ